MKKSKKIIYDAILSVSISQEQDKKVNSIADKKFNGNKSQVIRELIDKVK